MKIQASAGTGLSPNIYLGVVAEGIAWVTFMDTGNTFTIDDFQFIEYLINWEEQINIFDNSKCFSWQSLILRYIDIMTSVHRRKVDNSTYMLTEMVKV